MKRLLILTLALLLAIPVFSSCKDEPEYPDKVKITVKDFGEIVIELYPDIAPITVANFKKLVSENFYDGLIFHRVMKGFMIQGGDPQGTGIGGSGTDIKGEFSANGVPNSISHVRGVISMARSGNQFSGFDTASSQFFIVHQDSVGLDGQYAAFGRVISGMEVVDKIAEVPVSGNANSPKPLTDVVIESMVFVTDDAVSG